VHVSAVERVILNVNGVYWLFPEFVYGFRITTLLLEAEQDAEELKPELVVKNADELHVVDP
jgi:hypothetical protein